MSKLGTCQYTKKSKPIIKLVLKSNKGKKKMKKFTEKEFVSEFGKVDFSNNVRNPEKYAENAKELTLSLMACNGNNEPIITANVNGSTRIVSGFRRTWIILNADKIVWQEKEKDPETGKKIEVEKSADFSACQFTVEHVGKMAEAEYFKKLCNHTLVKGLDRYGQIQTVERLYRELKGQHTANKQIQDSTGLSRGIVTQSLKAIDLDAIQAGFLTAYIDGNIQTDAMSEIYPKVNKANEFSGDIRKAMIADLAIDCKKAIDAKISTKKHEKAMSRKEILALRDTIKEDLVELIEAIAGCKDAKIKSYLK